MAWVREGTERPSAVFDRMRRTVCKGVQSRPE